MVHCITAVVHFLLPECNAFRSLEYILIGKNLAEPRNTNRCVMMITDLENKTHCLIKASPIYMVILIVPI